MTIDDVKQRLTAEKLPWKLLLIAQAENGDPFLIAGDGIQIFFTESGLLNSVDISCYLPQPTSGY